MKNLFNKDYFENGINTGVSLYTNYRWIPELTIPMAFRMIEFLGIQSHEKVLDFGCAKGYLVQAMRLLYRECYGVDVSEYAVGESERHVRPHLHVIHDTHDLLELPFNVKKFDYIIAKDVFEHIPEEELKCILPNLHEIGRCLFVVVPLGDGQKYYEPAYEFDKTHLIRQDIDWWKNLFLQAGYSVVNHRYKIPGIKDNWKCENGNGMFVVT